MIIEPMEQEYDIADQARIKLMSAVPEAFADGKILWEKLRESLGDTLDDDDESAFEHYGLSWPGKRRAKKVATTPSTLTLTPLEGEGIDEDTTENIFIEGDNLEVLKILYKSYKEKIKMIYIDPPYNTGSDLVYHDDFRMTEDEFLRAEGTVDEQGNRFLANKKSNGRFHASWLSMMYPRLKIARELLKDDGVIFISIDDNEVHNLRMLCDEIFGEEHFLGQIIWKKKTNGNNMGSIPPVHDYIAVYAKNAISDPIIGFQISEKYIADNYSNPDEDPRGLWTTSDLSANHKGPYFPIVNAKTGESFLPPEGRYWVFNEADVLKRIQEGRIIFGKSGTARPIQKVFLSEKKSMRIKAESLWDKHGMNEDGTAEIASLLGAKIFTHAKPTTLIKNLVSIVSDKNSNDIILDFFAGSGTTAHALMQLNAEENAKRKYISVQLQEKIDSKKNKEAYDFCINTLEKPAVISEITKERIRRSSSRIKAKYTDSTSDFGLKIYKVRRSNHKKWGKYIINAPKEVDSLFKEHEHSLIDDWEHDSVLTEVILTEGFPLTSMIQSVSTVTSNTITKIASFDKEYALYVCLDNTIKPDTIKAIDMNDNDVFVCLGSAIDDQNLSALHDKGRIRIL